MVRNSMVNRLLYPSPLNTRLAKFEHLTYISQVAPILRDQILEDQAPSTFTFNRLALEQQIVFQDPLKLVGERKRKDQRYFCAFLLHAHR